MKRRKKIIYKNICDTPEIYRKKIKEAIAILNQDKLVEIINEEESEEGYIIEYIIYN